MHIRRIRYIRLAISRSLAVFCVFQCHASHAQWDFEFEADLGVVYTDNLRLADDGLEESEIVLTLSPTFLLSNGSERINAQIGYRPDLFFYKDAPESDAIYHTVDTNITTAIVRDALFVTLSGAKFQSNASVDDRFPTTNLPITGNRVDSSIWQVRPFWQQSLGFADVLAAVAYEESRFDAEALQQSAFTQNNSASTAEFDLNNHTGRQGLAWGLNYNYRRIEYDQALPFEFQTASANLGFWLNGTTRIFVLGGIETPFDSFLDAALEDEFWEAGFQFTPNQRLDLELAAGERSFGDTYRARFEYRLRRGSTSLTYDEGASTRALITAGRRPIFAPDILDSPFDRPGQSDRFIRKRGVWLTTIELSKSDMSLRVVSEDRQQRTTDAGAPLDDESLVGAAFRWAWRLAPNSTVGFTTDVSRRDTGVAENDLKAFSIDYALQFSQRLGVVLLGRHTEESGDISGNGRNYTENQFSVNLRVRL